MAGKDFYKVLGIARDADADAIKAACVNLRGDVPVV